MMDGPDEVVRPFSELTSWKDLRWYEGKWYHGIVKWSGKNRNASTTRSPRTRSVRPARATLARQACPRPRPRHDCTGSSCATFITPRHTGSSWASLATLQLWA